MNIRKLVHFLAVLEAKSFSKAAAQVHLSQPALSRSLQSLEHELGIPLFDRKGGKLGPSAHGAAVVEQIRRVLAEIQGLDEAVRRVKGLEEGKIRVGFGPFAAITALGSVLRQIVSSYPSLRVRVEVANSGLLLELLRHDRLDFVIGDVRYMTEQDELAVLHLPKQPMVFLANMHNPLLQRRKLKLADLRECAIGTPSLPPVLRQAFLSEGFDDFPNVNCDEMAVLIELAEHTSLVAMAPAIVVGDLGNRRRLGRLPVHVPFDFFAYPCIMTQRGQSLGPAGRMLIELVQARFASRV